MLETSTSIYALTFVEAGNAWYEANKFNPFDIETFSRSRCPHLPADDWLDGYRLGLRFRQDARWFLQYGGSQFHFILGQEF